MECYCDYDEVAKVYEAKVVMARKPHRCNECGVTIQSRERYERVGSLFDGRWDTYRTCARCLDLREFVKAHVPCFCWYHENMREDAIQTADHWAWKEQVPGLRFGALRREMRIRDVRVIERHRENPQLWKLPVRLARREAQC